MPLSMLPKPFQKLIRFRARKSAPMFGRFGRDVQEVMSARMWLAITGKLSAMEASRMVLEKQVAFALSSLARAHSCPGILHPRAASASISMRRPCIPTAKGSVNIATADLASGLFKSAVVGWRVA